MKLQAGITRCASNATATVFDLPGCEATARSIEELAELLPLVIAEHTMWLARHEVRVAIGTPPEIEISEEIDAEASGAADGEFCFQHDTQPVSDEELAHAIRRMAFARADLITLTGGLPPPLLDWRPPTSAMRQIDEWRPGVRTIREITQDIASAEFYYRTGLFDSVPPPDPDVELFNLDLQRERLIEALGAAPREERRRVHHPRREWQEGSEQWTMRKVLRRVIGHERFHTKEIEQRLAWLLIGVPDFSLKR